MTREIRLTKKQGARFLKGHRTETTRRVVVMVDGLTTRTARASAKLPPDVAQALADHLALEMDAWLKMDAWLSTPRKQP